MHKWAPVPSNPMASCKGEFSIPSPSKLGWIWDLLQSRDREMTWVQSWANTYWILNCPVACRPPRGAHLDEGHMKREATDHSARFQGVNGPALDL